MTKQLIISNAIIIFYVIQRISELLISKSHERWLVEHCEAVEVDPQESMRMRIFHSLWFISLLFEANYRNAFLPDQISLGIYILLGICLSVRFYTMEKLKQFWTVKIFKLKNQTIVTDGLFKYIRHPNYLVVILEFILLPLLFQAWVTLFLFSVLNLIVLSKRIKLEEGELMLRPEYSQNFSSIKKIVPFLFSLLLFAGVQAAEVDYHFKDYQEAKKSPNFIKFESTSTKFGMLTTSFDGYARDFKIIYSLSNNTISQIEILISVKDLDTDVDSRNEKMIETVFQRENYPQIKVSNVDKVNLDLKEQTIDMILKVKDVLVTKKVKLLIDKKDGKFFVTGSTQVSLSELKLPDPSIMIAKVKDMFDLSFSVAL